MINVIIVLLMLLAMYCALRPEAAAQRHALQWRRLFGEPIAERDSFMTGLYRIVGVMSLAMLAVFLILHNSSQG